MPKKKKTRKQKALADVRRQSDQRVMYTASIETKPQVKEEQAHVTKPASQPTRQTPPRSILTADYRYVGSDLAKTLTLTAIIIIIELVLKFGTGI